MPEISKQTEQIRKKFNRDRDALNSEFKITPDQRGTMTIFENAKKAGTNISYSHDPAKGTWMFTIGDQEVEISDPDVAAAAIGVASRK